MIEQLSRTERDSLARRMQWTMLRLLRITERITVRLRRVDNKQIIFESYDGRSYACSPRAIYEVMLADKRFNDYHFVWVFKNPGLYTHVAENERTTVVTHGSKAYRRAYARSGFWIVNTALSFKLAKHPTKQKLVQCFHGTPFKRLRHDIVDGTTAAIDSANDQTQRNRLDTIRYDYLLSPSPYATKHFTSAFELQALGKQDVVIETGYPRNDYLHTYKSRDATAIKKKLGIPLDKKVILYAPTWRDDQYDPALGYIFDPKLDFTQLRRDLGDEYVMLFRLHYNVTDTFDFSAYQGFIFDVSACDEINELYVVSDALITDYSSVFFDYANLRRPMLFYMYDRAHYEHDLRGFYLSVDELPGDIVTNQAALTRRLANFSSYERRSKAVVQAFHERFNPFDDGKAATRVIDTVWQPIVAK